MADEPVPLTTRFPKLQPGRRPGSVGAPNGFGTKLLGRRDYDEETGTYVLTHFAIALHIPIWALGAYRVVDAEGGGWFCLGREPLTWRARGLNAFLILAILGAVTGVWWSVHTGSPEYAAGQKLKQAERAAAAGNGGESARLCREVMDSKTSKAGEARRHLAGLIEDPPGAPGEAAAVYEVAVELHRDNRCPVTDLFEKGKVLAVQYAASDPTAALNLLEVIAPYAPAAADELAVRIDLLEKLFARSPDDPAVASRLAAAFEDRGDRDRCEKLLTPFECRLGTLDGAAILGRIYAARGMHDRAYVLLAPFVADRLPALRRAEQAYTDRIKSVQDAVVNELKSGKAPGFDYDRAKGLPEAERDALVNAYLSDRLKDDPALREGRRKLVAERGVIAAVLDLGMVQLQRAQTMADPAARRAELSAAEKTFLSVGGFVGKTDEYRLSLGQVYYWLGRQADGKKQFDELLADRANSTEATLLVARTLREVGDNTAARQLAEQAYNREADTAKKHAAARMRSVLYVDTDDEILWLSRSDPNSRDVQASLSTARGQKAEADGKDTEAADHFRQSIATYDKLPEGDAVLNNAALAHFALFRITLEPEEFTRGMDKLDRAIALNPKSSISLLNGASILVEAAARETVGKAIDFRPLKSPSAWEGVAYLYRTPAERSTVTDGFARHPGAVKARAYSEKLLLLAPKRDDGYQLLGALCEQTADLDGLKAVADRAAKADLDHGDAARKYKEYLTGESDGKRVGEARTQVSRTQAAVAAARPIGGPTFAMAVGRYVRAKTVAWALGQPVDADELVTLAEEAHATPSAGSESTLTAALGLRAHLALAREDKAYAARAERTKRSFGTSLLYFVLAGDGPTRAAGAKNADVKRLAALAEESFRRDPESAHATEWVVLRAVGSELAKPVGERAKNSERARAHRTLERATTPHAAATALGEYWQLLLDGKDAEAKKLIASLAARGVPVP
ncbi:tetratricopeptide repeat protein [Frigoriglobus tundricola]|uniref:Tetratricopeptide repeat protein n=1 Tax=Frigoriglobus tundricola TaxID=2774151 RepID=A0A6M5Z631_9BACT|nr:hypothetical protein [Frigoriglobus tundricola]QJX01042.1 hypothetical protein FTUN_8680 [Frigoriglobus tundricola]